MNLSPTVLVILFAAGGAGLLGEAAVLGVRRGRSGTGASLALLVGGASLLLFVSLLLSKVGY